VANGTALGKRFKGSFQSNTSNYGNSVSNTVLITREILRSGTAAGAVTAHSAGTPMASSIATSASASQTAGAITTLTTGTEPSNLFASLWNRIKTRKGR